MPTRSSMPGLMRAPGLANSARAVIARVFGSTRVSSRWITPRNTSVA
jgi:hypothetical protein